MKLLVETTGEFMLMDTSGRQEVQAARPSVVDNTNFINGRIASGFLKGLGPLKDDATDAEFAKYFDESKGDSNLAVESFLSTFGADAITEKTKTSPAAK